MMGDEGGWGEVVEKVFYEIAPLSILLGYLFSQLVLLFL